MKLATSNKQLTSCNKQLATNVYYNCHAENMPDATKRWVCANEEPGPYYGTFNMFGLKAAPTLEASSHT
jgi:hypothetical protein